MKRRGFVGIVGAVLSGVLGWRASASTREPVCPHCGVAGPRPSLEHRNGCPVKTSFYGGDPAWGVGIDRELRKRGNQTYRWVSMCGGVWMPVHYGNGVTVQPERLLLESIGWFEEGPASPVRVVLPDVVYPIDFKLSVRVQTAEGERYVFPRVPEGLDYYDGHLHRAWVWDFEKKCWCITRPDLQADLNWHHMRGVA